MTPTHGKDVWAFDVDACLVDSITGTSLRPLARPVLESLRAQGATVVLWSAGGGMIIWLAGLKGISETYYEAAALDGASAWQRFRHITLPLLSPYIFFNLIMGLIGTLQIFTQAFIMTQGGPIDSTLFYVYHIFNSAFRFLQMGYASALGWFLFVVVFGLTFLQLKLSKRWVHYEA